MSFWNIFNFGNKTPEGAKPLVNKKTDTNSINEAEKAVGDIASNGKTSGIKSEEKPKPVVKKPESVVDNPAPVVKKPEPVVEKPEPVVEKSAPVVDKSAEGNNETPWYKMFGFSGGKKRKSKRKSSKNKKKKKGTRKKKRSSRKNKK